MSTKKTAQIKLQFKSEAEAQSWLEDIKRTASFLAAKAVDVVKNTIVIIFEAVANRLLIMYGSFKDRLPYSLMGSSSYTPIRQ